MTVAQAMTLRNAVTRGYLNSEQYTATIQSPTNCGCSQSTHTLII
jgi:hypothetical protein